MWTCGLVVYCFLQEKVSRFNRGQLVKSESQDFKVWGRNFQAKSDFCNKGLLFDWVRMRHRHVTPAVRLTSPAYAGVRAGVDVAGGGRTRRGALETWRAGTRPGGRRGGRADAGGSAAEVSLTIHKVRKLFVTRIIKFVGSL